MASGDPVVKIMREMPPGTLFAPLTNRAGGSTPAEGVRVWAFDAGTIEYMDFLCFLEGYDGGGLTFELVWSAASGTTGDVVWSIAIRRFQDDAENLGSSHTYDFNNATADTAPSVNGEVSYPTITFTNGADMDSWADRELAIVRVRRFATDAGDTMNSIDAELWGFVGRET